MERWEEMAILAVTVWYCVDRSVALMFYVKHVDPGDMRIGIWFISASLLCLALVALCLFRSLR
jgi:hypothetical protein